ncbi:MAG TPA: hypothetical protein VFH73_18585 [Polyangia bacterium]|jgi:hypothetical protein|nr:hypothetical protein [Polyangia bacterium]
MSLLPVAARADSGPGSFDRHAVLVRPVAKPQGVPASYVFTRHGFFHPSCVVKLRADESIDNDGVIRDLYGQQRERIAPCAHPRFDRIGRLLEGAPTTAPPRAADLPAPGTRVPHAYDGWVIAFGVNIGAGFDFGSRLTYGIDWTVPRAPSKLSRQDIAFFSDIETVPASPSEPLGILQPVLEFNALNGRWWIISEYCCSPMDVQTEPIDVNIGDTIRGEIAGTNCASGACQDWAVTTTDVTTGKSTVLHRTGLPRIQQINPSVLETFNVTSCDMLPASGATTFFNHKVMDGTGAALMLRYGMRVFSSNTPPELPRDCGWATSSASSDQFTLIYGTTTVDAGAGPITDATVASDLGFPATSNDAALDTATDTAAPTPTPRVDSGLPGVAGAEGGCGCRLNDAPGAEGTATTLLGMAVVVLASRVSRRQARRRRRKSLGHSPTFRPDRITTQGPGWVATTIWRMPCNPARHAYKHRRFSK